MATNYTPIIVGASANADTFNDPLDELDAAIKKNNWIATSAPGVNHDALAGYSVGSRWVDITNDIAYTCVDATTGAAIWLQSSVTSGTIPVHDIVSAQHIITGAQYSLVGATALDTLGLLTPSADVSAGATAILRSNAGALTLARLGLGVSPSYQLDLQDTTSNATLGSNLITNGDFATGDFTGWTAGANWAVVANAAQHTAGSTETLAQNISVTNGQYYVVDWTQSGASAGTLTFTIGAAVAYTVNYSDSVKSVTIIATATGSLSFSITPSSTYNGTLDNIRVRQVSAVSPPLMQFRKSDGTVVMEFRTGGNTNNSGFGQTNLSYLVSSLTATVDSCDNLAFGSNALENTTTGYRNVGVGTQTLRRTTFGFENTGVGYSVAINNRSGYRNVAIGAQSLYNNLVGNSNVAVGTFALYTNQNASLVTAIGYEAFYNLNPASATNISSVAVGYAAGRAVTTGDFNTLIGTGAGQSFTTGSGNTCVGRLAGTGITVGGGNNTIIGAQAGSSIATASGNVFLGYRAGFGETGANTLMIDNVNRASEAVGRLYALVYGGFSTAPASQQLTVNGILQAQIQSALTNTIQNLAILDHQTSGTAAAGFGGSLIFQLQSSTTAEQSAARIRAKWDTATHASRAASMVLSAYDTAERDVIEIGANGSAGTLGFFAATKVVKQTGCAVPTDLATCITAITALRTALNNYGLTTVV